MQREQIRHAPDVVTPTRVAPSCREAPMHPVLRLQKRAGNRAVTQMIQSGSLSSFGAVQPKLTVGAADDLYEREADNIARQVMSAPDQAAGEFPDQEADDDDVPGGEGVIETDSPPSEADESVEGESSSPFSEEAGEATPLDASAMESNETLEDDPVDTVRRKPLPITPFSESAPSAHRTRTQPSREQFDAEPDIEEQLHQTKGRGARLPEHVQSFMEPRFGRDLSHVRVHTGGKAAQLNRSVGARAFAHGSDIYFGQGTSPANSELTAHELTHVLQQTSGQQVSLQRAMKFEIQTTNYLWRLSAKNRARLAPRKYGRRGATESGDESYVSTGVAGDELRVGTWTSFTRRAKPHAHKGAFVPAKDKKGTTGKKAKPRRAQFVWTYTVLDPKTLAMKKRPKKRTRKGGRIRKGIYEIRYVDRAGKRLSLHRDPSGRFIPGRGPLMKRAKKFKEGSAIEVQSESGGFIEFETPKWHRRWSGLRNRIQEAYDITKAMEAAPKVVDKAALRSVKRRIARTGREDPIGDLYEWPSSLPVNLPATRAGGRLLVEVVDSSWGSRVQSSESMDLAQYPTALKDYGWPSTVAKTEGKARAILATLVPSGSTLPAFEKAHANLAALVTWS